MWFPLPAVIPGSDTRASVPCSTPELQRAASRCCLGPGRRAAGTALKSEGGICFSVSTLCCKQKKKKSCRENWWWFFLSGELLCSWCLDNCCKTWDIKHCEASVILMQWHQVSWCIFNFDVFSFELSRAASLFLVRVNVWMLSGAGAAAGGRLRLCRQSMKLARSMI